MKLYSAAALGLLAVAVATPCMAKDWKTVVIGMEGGFAPYNLTDPSGKIVGFEPDLVMDLCARIKVQCKIIAQDWDGMIPGLNAGKFDVIMDGMSITEQRKKEIDFTAPYVNSPAAFIAAKDSPLAKLHSNGKVFNLTADPKGGGAALSELRKALKGMVIGVQVSTTHATFADKHLKDIATIKEYKTVDERDLDLKSGRIDVELDDYATLAAILEKPDSKDYAFAGPEFTGGDFGTGAGMGLRKSDADLTAKFDAALKAAFADGSVKKYSLKWFKIDTTP
ncbi:Octopine-binding periplasmic protein (plasmid) [Rhodovastum atsumiense]|uniref:Transporter substrate-binding domain-containing protein n=3 Tax=Rhodovastum atsumiense TaxID=504468 RepID=A0A5M6IJ97_9PROT|nr:transporter substrate-binding domain-containing protein [Rhodovastum atsumiense]CAH2605841.1 Octopine-binding periplasmic protein [Rhodovastum atsumiense]